MTDTGFTLQAAIWIPNWWSILVGAGGALPSSARGLDGVWSNSWLVWLPASTTNRPWLECVSLLETDREVGNDCLELHRPEA